MFYLIKMGPPFFFLFFFSRGLRGSEILTVCLGVNEVCIFGGYREMPGISSIGRVMSMAQPLKKS